MQVQTQNIQRPALFSDFFGLELIWNNEYLIYIHTFIKKCVTSALYDIKKSLNNKKFTSSLGRIWFSYQRDDVVIYKLLKIYKPDLNHNLHEYKFNLGVLV
ncbi:MAG: hypothetical protein PHQ93_03040 [Sulfurimonas sp.]|uniref:hypothetical protein n=1 Tax=Sulfurimonas sp. TaxID=2022749 RepID=UPI002619C670|nr:hypothetical protein [Sulfurimonas sp.]MDD5400147.1 hypothetical protein [Sulfurimonas sp.]